MIRKSIPVILVLLIVVAGYLFLSAFDTVSNVVAMGNEIFFPPAKKPVVVSSSGQSLSGFPAKFSNSLIVMENGTPRAVDTATLAGVKYWAFYYSASWCPPCRAFTPDLVSFYRDFKPSHPDFELIFVNDDRNEDDMMAYMRNDDMPWPAVRYGDIDNPDLEAKKYCGEGIPCLVLVAADGSVISDTFQNGEYTDPHHVIDDIRARVK